MVVLDSRTIKAKILNISFIILFWLNKRDNKIKNKPTIKIIISFFILFLASVFSFSSKMVISDSTSLDFLLTYFLIFLVKVVSNVKVDLLKLQDTFFRFGSLFKWFSNSLAQFAQSRFSILYLYFINMFNSYSKYFFNMVISQTIYRALSFFTIFN